MRFPTILLVILLTGLSLGAGGLFFITQEQWIDFSVLEHYNPGKPSIVLDDEGKEWTRFQLDRREPISIADVPEQLICAFMATEDREFFIHNGISWRGILRSLFVNLRSGKIVQGASTITQQLVKLLFFSNERTFKRKLKEALLTLVIEHQFSKEQILETYLNHIYLGNGIYGVQAAAQRFWQRPIEQLSLAQCSTLAGIVRSPNNYNPHCNPEASLKRRNLILKLMLDQQFITTDMYEQAYNEQLALPPSEQSTYGAHLKETLRQFLEELVGKHQLYTNGYTIQTTLNTAMQMHAEQTVHKHITKLRAKLPLNAALVSLEAETGAIKALVGGYKFSESQFNRAMQAQRQMGSIFKTFSYAAALEQGHKLSDVLIDEPITNIKDWNPRNVHRRFEGPMTRARALMSSNNIIAIKTLLDAGIPAVVNLAERCHLPGPFISYPSLALGCTECSPLQAAAAFNVFTNKGTYQEPYIVSWVKDHFGKKIWKHRLQPEPVIAWNISSQIVHTLSNAVQSLKRRMPNWWIKGECYGKTGTTNDARSCWFVGGTPHLTTSVYLGCDDNRQMTNQIFSVTHAVPLWLEFNRAVETLSSTTPGSFFYDPKLQKKIVHGRTGEELVDENQPQAITLLVDPSLDKKLLT